MLRIFHPERSKKCYPRKSNGSGRFPGKFQKWIFNKTMSKLILNGGEQGIRYFYEYRYEHAATAAIIPTASAVRAAARVCRTRLTCTAPK